MTDKYTYNESVIFKDGQCLTGSFYPGKGEGMLPLHVVTFYLDQAYNEGYKDGQCLTGSFYPEKGDDVLPLHVVTFYLNQAYNEGYEQGCLNAR